MSYWEGVFARFNFLIGHFDFVRLKRWTSEQKRIANDPHRPNIHFVGVPNRSFNNLRSDVVWCTAHGPLFLIGELKFGSEAKVADFNFHIGIQKDIS